MAKVTDIPRVFSDQRSYFQSGATRPYAYRRARLKALKAAIEAHRQEILNALAADMGKPAFEAYTSEVGFVIQDISHTLKWLKDWMRPTKVPTSIAHFPSKSRVYKEPLGQVLILAPWNYPFQLTIAPLVAAVAAGNTAFVKLPWQTPATAEVIDKILGQVFEEKEVVCMDIADDDIIPKLIQQQRFDHIFFTGSTGVGKLIMKAAAEHLTPVTLELGGKSPCIVDATADLKVAARRIAWAKAFNAGQTCVAPDYVLVEEKVKEQFVGLLENEFERIHAPEAEVGQIVNDKHYKALDTLLSQCTPRWGGARDSASRRIQTALVEVDNTDHPLMQTEIFGPILPILSWRSQDDIREVISTNEHPLSLYVYTSDRAFEKAMVHGIQFGGGCVNNSMVHLSNPDMPFGGIGSSGMGRYHSSQGFDTFSHQKSILKTGTWIDVPVRYRPYASWKMRAVKWLFG